MFRASDIFGRRPGSVPDKPKVEPKQQSDTPKARTWDAATGQFVEEDLPPEVQEMMRGAKKARIEPVPEPVQRSRPSGPPAAFAARVQPMPMQPVQPIPIQRLPAPPPPPPPPPMSQPAPMAPAVSRVNSPELSADQYRALVRQVYAEKNPDKLQDLPGLCKKYEGREREFLEQVCNKYQASFETLVGGALRNGQVHQNGGDDNGGNSFEQSLPELDSRQYAILVQAVYQKKNPSKLADLARLLQRYRGKEKDFYLQVCEKYEVHSVQFYKEEGKALLAEI